MHLEIIICAKRITSWKILKSSFSSCPCLFCLTIPSVTSKSLLESRFCAKAEPCVILWGEVVLCVVWSGIVREPSVARRGGHTGPWVRCWRDAECWGEPLPKTGGGEEGGTVCVGRDILNRMLTWSGLSGENEIMLNHRNTMLWLRGSTVWRK